MLELFTRVTLQDQLQNASGGDIPIVHQHDLECSRLADSESRLMELEVNPERLEGFTHVVREPRLELERFDVLEMISGIGPGPFAREVTDRRVRDI